MAVLIAGAGPTGLTLACALLQQGVPVRVVDAAPAPATTSRALGLQARGVEVLDRIGALGDLPERAVSVLRVTVEAGGRQVTELRVGEWMANAGRPGVIISQAEIEGQLRRRLEELGGKVEWGVQVVDVEQDDTGVTVTVTGDQTIRADWLAGSDGAHSRVRKLAGIGFPGVPIIERFLIADVHADIARPRNGVVSWMHPDGMFAAFTLPGKDLWRLMADVPDGGEESDVLAQLSKLLSVRTGMTGVRIKSAEWTSTFRIQRRLADTYRRGRILLAGDAAHIHSPFGGQGMNTGMGDAENLAWKLALVTKGKATDALLDTYEAERRPIAEEVLSGTTFATKLLLGSTSVTKFLRDRFALPLMNLSWAQDRLIRRASQLEINYRGGPLATKDRAAAGPRLGDRVPDLKCARSDGSTTRLHRELEGRWGLLVPTGKPVPTADQLGDDLVVLRYDLPEVLLVRPDAHLAWRDRPSAARLSTWLDNVLTRGRTD